MPRFSIIVLLIFQLYLDLKITRARFLEIFDEWLLFLNLSTYHRLRFDCRIFILSRRNYKIFHVYTIRYIVIRYSLHAITILDRVKLWHFASYLSPSSSLPRDIRVLASIVIPSRLCHPAEAWRGKRGRWTKRACIVGETRVYGARDRICTGLVFGSPRSCVLLEIYIYSRLISRTWRFSRIHSLTVLPSFPDDTSPIARDKMEH